MRAASQGLSCAEITLRRVSMRLVNAEVPLLCGSHFRSSIRTTIVPGFLITN